MSENNPPVIPDIETNPPYVPAGDVNGKKWKTILKKLATRYFIDAF